jgi:putative phage-type endonuclease
MNSNVQTILDMYQTEQRTEEWYKIRHNMITASDVATALGVNKYQSINSLIKKKLQISESNNGSSSATLHGNKFEDEARLLFEDRFKLKTWEIGLFQHSNIKWLGGSPDGIAADGNLIEIKCPVTREIVHDIPVHYYPQVQICMEILDRPACYFIQYKPSNCFQNGLLDVKLIERDKTWFSKNIIVLERFWNKVLFYREYGYCKFDHKKIIDLTDIDLPISKVIDYDSYSDDED